MSKPRSEKRILKTVLGNFALVMLGVGIALGLTELLLRTYPHWVPGVVRVDPPVRRVEASIDESYDVRLSNGDLFYYMAGTIVPLAPDEDQIVAQVHLTTDENGFRNPLPEKPTYGMVALGDSFTVATNAAYPWPQKLAEYSGIDVLNLGVEGAGPQRELEVLRQYGLKKRPQWVILAFFEGNDLYDAGGYETANPFILTRVVSYLLGQSREAWQERRSGSAHAAIAPSYRYPITLSIKDTNLEMAFFSSYIAWLSVSRKAIESSENYRLVSEKILEVQEISEAMDARFLLVYVPTKLHVYLPYLNDTETLARVFIDVPMIEVGEGGYLQFTNQTVTPELTSQNMDEQADLLAEFAAGHNIVYLDLTSTFQEEAGKGAELFYPFDTHWNQHGHDLAAQTIAKYIEDMLTVTASKKPGN